MKANYKAFIDRVIERYEGGYGWDAGDPGGPTKFGITCYDLAEERHEKMNSMGVWAPLVRAMPLSEAETIYMTKYASACDFNELNSGPDCCILDLLINSGLGKLTMAQRIVGVPQDGKMGPVTLEAINRYNPKNFVDILCANRLAFLRQLNTWGRFGTGWTNRVNDLRNYCHKVLTPVPVAIAGIPEDPFEEKVQRIPLAFAKAYEWPVAA